MVAEMLSKLLYCMPSDANLEMMEERALCNWLYAIAMHPINRFYELF
jgi:hypothetical protein